MSKEQIEVAATAQPAPPDFTSCPDWGKGGRYVYDPATQTRTRVPDEADAPAETPIKKDRARG